LSDIEGTLFSEEQIFMLLQGLTALEGALQAISQPLPGQLHELKGKLRAELSTLERDESETLTTEQVAEILQCTGKRVHQLASSGAIKVAQVGKRGRGYSSLFYRDSVREYMTKRSRRFEQR